MRARVRMRARCRCVFPTGPAVDGLILYTVVSVHARAAQCVHVIRVRSRSLVVSPDASPPDLENLPFVSLCTDHSSFFRLIIHPFSIDLILIRHTPITGAW